MEGKLSSNNNKAFFALVRAGLWENNVQLLPYGEIDFAEVHRLAEEQSVVGFVAAGLEHVEDIKVDKKDLLHFIGQTLQLEQQNQAMNYFIGVLVDKMKAEGITTLLVKGQGIAQCYERPLWRACGDVDFFLSEDNYLKARAFLTPLARNVDGEGELAKHLSMTIDPWVVELHGSLRCGLSFRIDKCLDKIKDDIFNTGNVRLWMNGKTEVQLPGVTYDAIYVFTHILSHFYKGGVGLRQICDLSRLLWVYREEIDISILEHYLRKMRLVTQWKAFGAFCVNYLGLTEDAMPLYDNSTKWSNKADKICSFVIEVGNMGHNRDTSYYERYPYFIRKACSVYRRCYDLIRHASIFPLDSIRFFPALMVRGFQAVIHKLS